MKIERPPVKASKRTQLLATLFATIGSFGLGTVLSWSAPTLPQLDLETHGLCDHDIGEGEGLCLRLTRDQQSWVASLLNFGAFTAGPISGLLMPRCGKKVTMMLLSVPIFAGWLCLILADTVWLIYIGRFLTGFSGSFSMLAPGFISEICQVEIRGSLASIMQVMTMLGLLFTYTIGTFLDWRMLSLVCSCVPVICVICLSMIPRSPSFLLASGDKMRARSSLQYYRGPDFDVNKEFVELEHSVLKSQAEAKSGIIRILTKTTYVKPLALSLMLMLLQQFSGIKVINSYIVQIFQNAGSKFDANICAIVVGVIQVTGTSISVLVVDKFGRRKLLILSELFIGFAFCMLGSFFFVQEYYNHITTDLAWLPLASIVTFAVAYSMGMGPLPWVMTAELFSKEAKATSSSLAASFNWLCSFLVVKFSPTLEALIGASGSYLLFAGLAFLGTLLIWVTVPETRGKTEEEIARHFMGRASSDTEGGAKIIEEEESQVSEDTALFRSKSPSS